MSSIWDVSCLTNHMDSAHMFKGMYAPVWCVITDCRRMHWKALWLISLSTWASWKSDAISVCSFPSLIKHEKEQKQREHKEKRDKGTKGQNKERFFFSFLFKLHDQMDVSSATGADGDGKKAIITWLIISNVYLRGSAQRAVCGQKHWLTRTCVKQSCLIKFWGANGLTVLGFFFKKKTVHDCLSVLDHMYQHFAQSCYFSWKQITHAFEFWRDEICFVKAKIAPSSEIVPHTTTE